MDNQNNNMSIDELLAKLRTENDHTEGSDEKKKGRTALFNAIRADDGKESYKPEEEKPVSSAVSEETDNNSSEGVEELSDNMLEEAEQQPEAEPINEPAIEDTPESRDDASSEVTGDPNFSSNDLPISNDNSDPETTEQADDNAAEQDSISDTADDITEDAGEAEPEVIEKPKREIFRFFRRKTETEKIEGPSEEDNNNDAFIPFAASAHTDAEAADESDSLEEDSATANELDRADLDTQNGVDTSADNEAAEVYNEASENDNEKTEETIEEKPGQITVAAEMTAVADEINESEAGEDLPAPEHVARKSYRFRKVSAPSRRNLHPAKLPAPDAVGAELAKMSENAEVPTIDEVTEAVGNSEEYVESVSGGVEGSFAHVDEFDETDVKLMAAFGMENELKDKIGEDKAKEITEKFAKQATDIMEKAQPKRITELTSETEYNSPSKTNQIIHIYKKLNRSVNVRMILAILLLVVTALFENASALGITLPPILDRSVYPVIYILFGLQLTFLAAGCAFRSLGKGLSALLRFKPCAESVYALAMILSTAYHIALCFLYDQGSIVLFETPMILMALLSIIVEKLNLYREVSSFLTITGKKPKFVLKNLKGEDGELEKKGFEEYIDEDSYVMGVKTAPFVSGFFGRVKTKERLNPTVIAAVWITFISVIAICALGIIRHKSIYSGITLGYQTLMVISSAAILAGLALPAWNAQRKAQANGSAIIGDVSADEFSNTSVVSFSDRDIFVPGSVKVKSVKTFNGGKIDRVIYETASIFAHIGGPLSDVFNITIKDLGKADDVTINKVVEGGIEAFIGRKIIFIGNSDFIRGRGYEPIDEEDDRKAERNGRTCIMYMVSDSVLCAKIYLGYSFDVEFEQVVEKLYKAGLCVGIRTLDPNINETMLSKHIDLTMYPVKILRTDPTQEEDTGCAIDAGIVSKRGVKELLQTSTLCEGIFKKKKIISVFAVISILLGILYSAFTILSTGNAPSPSSLLISGYQLIFVIIAFIISVLGA